MSRKVIAVLLSLATIHGGIAPQTAAAPAASTTQQSSAAHNQPALKPGSAAGVREAQGTADRDVWFISGLILASIVAALLLTEEDDDSTDSTGGTN